MVDWQDAPDLRALAEEVIEARDDVAHVDVNEVLFLWENELKPKLSGGVASAICWKLKDHPIGHFTDARFAIVFYRRTMDWMTERQRAVLMWHELRHIPERGDRLVQHDVQDFAAILREAGIGWANQGEGVPDIRQRKEG